MIDIIKKFAYKIVNNDLCKNDIFNGKNLEKHETDFMLGIYTLMEYIATKANKVEDFDDRFVDSNNEFFDKIYNYLAN